jgi:nicotinate-nucleotide pyrophosphorylase (carboxylating)
VVLRAALSEGQRFRAGQTLATLVGPAQALLTGERTALNFLQRLCGVATLTRAFVEAVRGSRAVICDTRKTTPGWRRLEKYAVRCGGGTNHRMGLYDEMLIKDNHLALAGRDLKGLVTAARRRVGPRMIIEVEVERLEQLHSALALPVDYVLLDNMAPPMLRKAVALRDAVRRDGWPLLEASGGVTLDNVRAVASAGVDRISVGALTHSAPALDIAMDICPP